MEHSKLSQLKNCAQTHLTTNEPCEVHANIEAQVQRAEALCASDDLPTKELAHLMIDTLYKKHQGALLKCRIEALLKENINLHRQSSVLAADNASLKSQIQAKDATNQNLMPVALVTENASLRSDIQATDWAQSNSTLSELVAESASLKSQILAKDSELLKLEQHMGDLEYESHEKAEQLAEVEAEARYKIQRLESEHRIQSDKAQAQIDQTRKEETCRYQKLEQEMKKVEAEAAYKIQQLESEHRIQSDKAQAKIATLEDRLHQQEKTISEQKVNDQTEIVRLEKMITKYEEEHIVEDPALQLIYNPAPYTVNSTVRWNLSQHKYTNQCATGNRFNLHDRNGDPIPDPPRSAKGCLAPACSNELCQYVHTNQLVVYARLIPNLPIGYYHEEDQRKRARLPEIIDPPRFSDTCQRRPACPPRTCKFVHEHQRRLYSGLIRILPRHVPRK